MGTMAGMACPKRSAQSVVPNSDDAIKALRRMRSQGYDLNPQDSEHISAYMTLRANTGRIDGRRLVAYLASKRTDGSQKQRP